MVDAGRQEPGARPAASHHHDRRQASRTCHRPRRTRTRDARHRDRARRGYRRRSLAADLHRLPSRASRRAARRTGPAAPGRPVDAGDRPRFPGARSHRRPAHRARQANPSRCCHPVRDAARGRAPRTPRRRAGGGLSHLQRGLCGDRRTGLAARRSVRRGTAPRPLSGGADARRARGGGGWCR